MTRAVEVKPKDIQMRVLCDVEKRIEGRCEVTMPDDSVRTFLIRPWMEPAPESAQDEFPVHRIYDMRFRGVTELVDGVEHQIEGFRLEIHIPHNDYNDGCALDRVDETLFTPPDITASWREVVS